MYTCSTTPIPSRTTTCDTYDHFRCPVLSPRRRYSTTGWGFMIRPKIAWFVSPWGAVATAPSPPLPHSRSLTAALPPSPPAQTQEIGSFAVPVLWLTVLATPEQLARLRGSPAGLALLSTFLAHYSYRDLVYPFRLRSTKNTPFIVWAMAFVFCIFNGYMQTRYLLDFAPPGAPLSPRVLAGLGLWATGWAINLHSDNILLGLRKPGDKRGGYKIPHGGAFQYVSAANYLGECIEWG